MGLLQLYSLLLLRNPGRILFAGVFTVACLFSLALLLRPFPTFRDPLIGFETRGTTLANRLNAFRLLSDERTASANDLSLVANSDRYEYVDNSSSNRVIEDITTYDESFNRLEEPPIVEMSTQQIKNSSNILSDEDEYYMTVNRTRDVPTTLMHYSLGSSKAFCGKLYEGYAQVIVAPSIKNSNTGLFNLNSMISICQLDRKLRLEHSNEDSLVFQSDCERYQSESTVDSHSASSCCNSWSLPNYVACLNNRTSCIDLKPQDMLHMEQLLNLCSPYYFRAPYEECFYDNTIDRESSAPSRASMSSTFSILSGSSDHWTKARCGLIPEKCSRCNGWTFTVMNYLVNENFIKPRSNNSNTSKARQQRRPSNKETLINKLTHTNIFLPVAKSTSLMSYYKALTKYDLKTPYAHVKAMDLGLKNSLFEHLISEDAILFIIALISILTVISIYTWSILLSFVILMIICLSLCLSYSIYVLILDIPIFPFMNLLAVVISFGICSDNAMLFCNHWTDHDTMNDEEITSCDKDIYKEQINLIRMLKRAVISTTIATVATASSFMISAISRVVAVRCFCIYATLSVLTNYLLIVLLLPPALIIDSRLSNFIYKLLANKGPKITLFTNVVQKIRSNLLELGKSIHNVRILYSVTSYKLYFIILFVSIFCCSSILVFVRPGINPSDEDDIQLLSSEHTFEQYNSNLRKQFAFERTRSADIVTSQTNSLFETPETLPIRVVFGVKPIDNGNEFDPHDRGSLVFDPSFDPAEPNGQIWLLDFCHKLRNQRFVHPSSSSDLTNCFIDTFKSWMETRSCKDPVLPDVDRSPCCEAYEFPYTKTVFNKCIKDAVDIVRRTPKFNANSNPGIYFIKNTTKIAALVLEYQSNRLYTESYTKMERFFLDIDDWVTWQINNTAPPSMKSGWFISSNLDLLALQGELEQSTSTSIFIEILFASLALGFGTRSVVLTLAGTITIGNIIVTTIAVLIILKWTLGVAESILITLTIGLSIDFALHYSVAFGDRRHKGSINGIIHRILDEVGSPIALATITTSLAGFVILWSDILAYRELGVFLMVIAIVSWASSTFFLLPILATISSIQEFWQAYTETLARGIFRFLLNRL